MLGRRGRAAASGHRERDGVGAGRRPPHSRIGAVEVAGLPLAKVQLVCVCGAGGCVGKGDRLAGAPGWGE